MGFRFISSPPFPLCLLLSPFNQFIILFKRRQTTLVQVPYLSSLPLGRTHRGLLASHSHYHPESAGSNEGRELIAWDCGIRMVRDAMSRVLGATNALA